MTTDLWGGDMMGNERGMWKDRGSIGRRDVKIGEQWSENNRENGEEGALI